MKTTLKNYMAFSFNISDINISTTTLIDTSILIPKNYNYNIKIVYIVLYLVCLENNYIKQNQDH